MDDALESPADRHTLIERLIDDGIEWARRARSRSVTIVAIELDNLETLRSDLGAAGVADLLAAVDDRLAKLQAVESVRIGDEFVLVSRAPRSTFDAFSLADRVARTLARPAVVGAFEVALTANIGVCQSWNGIGGGPMLVRDAQFALDEAKKRGQGKAVVLTPELHRRRANNHPAEIRMQFAPVVSLDDGSVSTYEATVISGRIPGFADADSSTFELLFDELARTVATWSPGVHSSVKVSREQLCDADFLPTVGAIAHRYGLGHDRFAFEIDEREAAEDLLHMQLVVTRLRNDGWKVGLSGVAARSALDTLALLPVRYVKIDLAPLHPAESESDLASLASAARSHEIGTVATGIETLSELALALAHKFDFAQGSLFGVQLSAPPSE